MRIALVAPLVTTIAQPYTGGSQAMVAELARGLQRRKHEVTLFARAGSYVPDIHIEAVSLPSIVQPTNFSISNGDRLAEANFFTGFITQSQIFLDLFLQLQQRHDEFDVVHAHAFDWPSFVCSTIVHNLPVIHTLHLPAIIPEINEVLQVLDRRGHPLTLATVSHACAQSYATYTPIDTVIYNGMDVEAIPFSPSVPADAPLLFAGRITPEKGVEEAIDIARRARCRLLIAGGVYDEVYYQERIVPALQDAQEYVTYLGHLEHPELWQLMSTVRGMLFPITWDEPFGLAAVEAMAAGTPVIAFERGAAQEIIQHGVTGFLVEPGDCEQAAMYVAQLSALDRVQCRAHVAQHFSFANMLDRYEDVYLTLRKR